MNSLMDAKGVELFWEQPRSLQRRFILTSGEQVFAQLDFNSSFSALADGITDVEHWQLNRVGAFSTRVIIRPAGAEAEIASYSSSWTGTHGQVRFITGQGYQWKVANFWATRFTISRDDGSEIITYLTKAKKRKLSNLLKQQAQVVITPEAWQIRELPILVLLGWYLTILHHEDSAAAATTASIAVLN